MNDKLKITIDGEERILFMSFGLLNELASLVQDPARVPAIPVDSYLREAVLSAAFAKRKKSGKITEEIADFDDIDVTIEDVEATLDWVIEHVMSFFVRSLRKVVQVTQANETDLKDLASFLAGSAVSPSATA